MDPVTVPATATVPAINIETLFQEIFFNVYNKYCLDEAASDALARFMNPRAHILPSVITRESIINMLYRHSTPNEVFNQFVEESEELLNYVYSLRNETTAQW